LRLTPLLLGVVALAACSGSSRTTTPVRPSAPSSTTTPGGFTALYADAVAPADAAIARFNSQASAFTNSASVSDLARITKPLADTLDRVDTHLLAIAWPPKLTPDIRAVVTADAVVISDLRSVSRQSGRTISTLKQRFSGDLSNLATKVSVVVNELTPTSQAVPSAG
jgi:hypothetical protein